MFNSTGTLVYSINPYKLIVNVDDELGRYYRWFIPKSHRVQKPMYSSHISVVRKEVPVKLDNWNKYQNHQVDFVYEPHVYNDEIYYWLNAYSVVLENIRLELGLLALSQYTMSPDKRHKFHITIANTKHLL